MINNKTLSKLEKSLRYVKFNKLYLIPDIIMQKCIPNAKTISARQRLVRAASFAVREDYLRIIWTFTNKKRSLIRMNEDGKVLKEKIVIPKKTWIQTIFGF
jgi:hypothetical protein